MRLSHTTIKLQRESIINRTYRAICPSATVTMDFAALLSNEPVSRSSRARSMMSPLEESRRGSIENDSPYCYSSESDSSPSSSPEPGLMTGEEGFAELATYSPLRLVAPSMSDFNTRFDILTNQASSLQDSRITRRRTNALGDVFAMFDLGAMKDTLRIWRDNACASAKTPQAEAVTAELKQGLVTELVTELVEEQTSRRSICKCCGGSACVGMCAASRAPGERGLVHRLDGGHKGKKQKKKKLVSKEQPAETITVDKDELRKLAEAEFETENAKAAPAANSSYLSGSEKWKFALTILYIIMIHLVVIWYSDLPATDSYSSVRASAY